MFYLIFALFCLAYVFQGIRVVRRLWRADRKGYMREWRDENPEWYLLGIILWPFHYVGKFNWSKLAYKLFE